MRRNTNGLVSPLHHLALEMPHLGENRIDASNSRDVTLWWPKGEDPAGKPLLLCLAPYLNSGNGLTGWRNFGESVPERCDRLYEDGAMGPAVIAFIDSYNRLGGNQFVNSPVIGNWVDGLAEDLVPALEAQFGCGGAGKRGLFGHSSGGFGALYNLMRRPDIWSAVLAAYDFDVDRFLDDLWRQEKPKGEQISALMVLALAASYDPVLSADGLKIQLPVESDTCELIPERWEKWLSFDPLSLAPAHLPALQAAKFLYLDCGRSDEYNILYGTRRLSAFLTQSGVRHIMEEFDGGHGTIGPRYEVSLPQLVDSVS